MTAALEDVDGAHGPPLAPFPHENLGAWTAVPQSGVTRGSQAGQPPIPLLIRRLAPTLRTDGWGGDMRATGWMVLGVMGVIGCGGSSGAGSGSGGSGGSTHA